MDQTLAKTYNPHEVEDRIYSFWNDNGWFHTEIDETKKPYTIVIPPPNITGQLHMGHALDNTLQDILIRFKRMQGYCALWIPGTDHAAIATEAKLVEALRSEDKTKEEVGREGFLQRAWEWNEIYGGRIIEQLKKLGTSCDWKRLRFTMDEGCNKAVREVFNRLYEKGLIYRGERIINWCPRCKTTISDAEVVFTEQGGNLWYIRYPLTEGDGYITVATTRPETMLGDTAVAVNPNDERYQHLIGKTVELPLTGRKIPIIADDYVEPDFGTGAVKITPAHDPNDFEVGARHNLPIINVMDDTGHMNENGRAYQNLDRYEARKKIIADLTELNLLEKIEDIKHNVGGCYRCTTTVEPTVSMQWFVKMKPLAEPALEAVRTGETRFIPDRFDKIYYHWMENIKDWCISRQIWWGHQIPAWYCGDCGEMTVSRETPTSCSKCGGTRLRQDEDTLDTWFSSALWPFSTLRWPDETPDYKFFYPTNTLVTGYDIIFFWVARMIFSAIEYTGQVPFDTVFIHGIVRDENGIKMSKSLGNGVDPLDEIEKYGADALRFMLVSGTSPGNDMRYIPEKVEASRGFANKLWNAARFVLMNLEGHDVKGKLPNVLTVEDKWIVSRYNSIAREIADNLDKFELGVAVQKAYDFIWDEFCDWYIELAKTRLQGGETESGSNVREVLVWTLDGILRLLHPFMPFVTEEIWQSIPHEGNALMNASWHTYDEALNYPDAENEMDIIMETIRAIRTRRSEMNVPPSRKAKVYIATEREGTFSKGTAFIRKLASASEVIIDREFELPDAVTIVVSGGKVYIPLDDLIDREAEKVRLTKELTAVKKELEQAQGKLSNPGFTGKAPEKVVAGVRQTAVQLTEKLAALEAELGRIN